MSNQQILEKAIQKAIEGGWKGSPYPDYMKLAGEQWKSDMVMGEGIWLVAIVYSPPHDFAKSFFGYDMTVVEEMKTMNGDTFKFERPAWEAHLQKMVVEEDPISYLEMFI
jgi:hypothetical protein